MQLFKAAVKAKAFEIMATGPVTEAVKFGLQVARGLEDNVTGRASCHYSVTAGACTSCT